MAILFCIYAFDFRSSDSIKLYVNTAKSDFVYESGFYFSACRRLLPIKWIGASVSVCTDTRSKQRESLIKKQN